jgi:hypothetical protein
LSIKLSDTTTKQPITLYHRKGIDVKRKQQSTITSATIALIKTELPEIFFV